MTRPKCGVHSLSTWGLLAQIISRQWFSQKNTMLLASGKGMVVLALLGSLALEGSAGAQGGSEPESQAESLNSQGKVLIRQLDLVGAAKMFRAAMVLSEDPRFAFNLCYTLEKSGRLVEARRVCEKVLDSNNDRLVEKAEKLLESIVERQEIPIREPVVREPVVEKPEVAEIKPTVEVRGERALTSESTSAQTRNTHFGGVVGIALAGIEGQGDTSFRVGAALGAWLRWAFARNYELVVEGQFVQRKFRLLSDQFGRPSVDFSSTYLDLGTSVRWRFAHTSVLSPYIEGGAGVSVLVGNTVSADLFARKTVDLSWTASVGTEIEIGGQVVDVRVHYVQGLLDSKASGTVSRGGAYNRAILMQAGFWL